MAISKILNPHQRYLLNHYKKTAQLLKQGKITPEQFALEEIQVHASLEQRASFDGLIISFLNNHGFTQALERELKLIKRLKDARGVLMAIDIDKLKHFNDELGHIAGDKLIKTYAKVIDANTRASDLRGRLGGDEFAVFLVSSSIISAQIVAERIRTSVITEVKKVFPDLSWNQTASIGLAQVNEQDTAESLRTRADNALYEAKEKRNTVVIEGEILPNGQLSALNWLTKKFKNTAATT